MAVFRGELLCVKMLRAVVQDDEDVYDVTVIYDSVVIASASVGHTLGDACHET